MIIKFDIFVFFLQNGEYDLQCLGNGKLYKYSKKVIISDTTPKLTSITPDSFKPGKAKLQLNVSCRFSY